MLVPHLASLMIEQIFSNFRIDFTVDRGREFARPPAALIGQPLMKCNPAHIDAARPQSLANRFRFVRRAIGKLRPRIDAEQRRVDERRGFNQL